MTRARRLSWLAWPLFLLSLAGIAAAFTFIALAGTARSRSGWGTGTIPGFVALVLPFAASAVVGFSWFAVFRRTSSDGCSWCRGSSG